MIDSKMVNGVKCKALKNHKHTFLIIVPTTKNMQIPGNSPVVHYYDAREERIAYKIT
jgi:hypothetical protein